MKSNSKNAANPIPSENTELQHEDMGAPYVANLPRVKFLVQNTPIGTKGPREKIARTKATFHPFDSLFVFLYLS